MGYGFFHNSPQISILIIYVIVICELIKGQDVGQIEIIVGSTSDKFKPLLYNSSNFIYIYMKKI